MRLNRFLMVLLGVLGAIAADGNPVQIIADSTKELLIKGPAIDIYEDVSAKMSVQEISKRDFVGFLANTEPQAFNKNFKSAYWLRFRINNRTSNTPLFLLECHAPYTQLIQLYIPDGKGGYYLKEGGSNFAFFQREHLNKNLLFDLPVPLDGQVHTFYIRVLSNGYSLFDYRVKPVKSFMHYISGEYYFLGIYYGILLIMMLYNLILYFSIRERVYVFYVCYILSGMLLTLSEDGLGFQYLWPSFTWMGKYVSHYIGPLSLMISYIFYFFNFLELNQTFPRQRRLLLLTTAGYLFYFLVSSLFSLYCPPILFVVPFLVAYYQVWYTFLKGHRLVRVKFFLIGSTVTTLGILVLQLRWQHWIESTIVTVYLLNGAMVLESIILSLAMSDRVRAIKREKEQAQQQIILQLEENRQLHEKVNRELEQKVKDRTIELQEKNIQLEGANAELQRLNETINAMNAKLDYDNWYLKKDLKQGLQARVLSEEVTYEQFRAIFPDEKSSFKFLEEYKWGQHYQCARCANIKYTRAQKEFARKCSRCGNVESVTAYTLFHGVRFPIHKAFYIVYIVHRKGDMVTSQELADLLELNRNTCWAFKRKVMEHIEEYRKTHGWAESWEQLIVLDKKAG